MENHIRKSYIVKLKTAIAKNVEQSTELRIDAQFEKGLERHKLHIKKRYLGYDTRRYLLIYAFLRGVPYKACEPKIHDAIDSSSIIYSIRNMKIEIDKEDLQVWMAGVKMEREVA